MLADSSRRSSTIRDSPVPCRRWISHPSPSSLCSSPKISCCSTILYTLALSRVKTVVVFLSRPRKASRISADGLAANSARTLESYSNVSMETSKINAVDGETNTVKVANKLSILVKYLLLQWTRFAFTISCRRPSWVCWCIHWDRLGGRSKQAKCVLVSRTASL